MVTVSGTCNCVHLLDNFSTQGIMNNTTLAQEHVGDGNINFYFIITADYILLNRDHTAQLILLILKIE